MSPVAQRTLSDDEDTEGIIQTQTDLYIELYSVVLNQNGNV